MIGMNEVKGGVWGAVMEREKSRDGSMKIGFSLREFGCCIVFL